MKNIDQDGADKLESSVKSRGDGNVNRGTLDFHVDGAAIEAIDGELTDDIDPNRHQKQ